MGIITKWHNTKDWKDTEQYPHQNTKENNIMVSTTPRNTWKMPIRCEKTRLHTMFSSDNKFVAYAWVMIFVMITHSRKKISEILWVFMVFWGWLLYVPTPHEKETSNKGVCPVFLKKISFGSKGSWKSIEIGLENLYTCGFVGRKEIKLILYWFETFNCWDLALVKINDCNG